MNQNNQREAILALVESRSDIDGRFTNVRRVGQFGGRGNFSLVFQATDNESGRDVAIKIFNPNNITDNYRYQCFLREAQILNNLGKQPDIIQAITPASEFVEMLHSQTAGAFPWRFPYFALELAQSDVDAILENGGWNPEQTLLSFHVMCRAVQRIHSRNIVHRDIKPGNFLEMADGTIKLSDFGTARLLDGATPMLLPSYPGPPGELLYAAPEIHACIHDVQPSIALKADIFSLGAILFELFTHTKLGLYIYDESFYADLANVIGQVQRRQRKEVYDRFIAHITNSKPLPNISMFTQNVPPCIRDRVDALYQSLAALDYNVRLDRFDDVFQKIQTCLLILRNEEKYRRWCERKRLFEANREKKRERRQLGRKRRS